MEYNRWSVKRKEIRIENQQIITSASEEAQDSEGK